MVVLQRDSVLDAVQRDNYEQLIYALLYLSMNASKQNKIIVYIYSMEEYMYVCMHERSRRA